ncbi:hypothetical protein Vadar_028945 [Vaccinium darrowii]|uniref:Uncharacterized protein n=1 Tax=Vaccinium darrowii TaxID=229202 RepID=A0ACB7ZG24_9ERIC|nr:hypothetical protein Vadar_028945 [Vaccinium darrowii]
MNFNHGMVSMPRRRDLCGARALGCPLVHGPRKLSKILEVFGVILLRWTNTLKGGSYEKGRILIATDQSQNIEGNIELVANGTRYMVRIEEEGSFRKVESSNFIAVNNSMSIHENQLSQVPKEAQSLVKDLEEDPINNSSKFTQGLESFVEDSLGLQPLFNEIQVDKPVEKTSSHEKFVDANSDDSSSIDNAVSGVFDYGD